MKENVLQRMERIDAKRQWDEQRAAARSVQRGEGDYYSYTADRIYGAKKKS